MNALAGTTERASRWDLDLSRDFDAPRELVFAAWTDPQHLAAWWGPHGFSNPVCEVDVRPGGAIRIVMRGPDGVDYPMMGVFEEIVRPERIVFTSTVDDGGAVHFDVRTTVTLAEQAGRTRLTLQARVLRATPPAAQYLDGMAAGWSQSLERLAAHVAAA